MTSRTTLAVGITGHRPKRLGIHEAQVERRCMDALAAIAGGARGATLVGISGMAEGADRAFAQAALTTRYRLDCILPFGARDYESTFSDPLGVPVYRRVLTHAAQVTELDGNLADRDAAYAKAGAAIVAASDILLAVWDGDASEGAGGTSQVIAMALSARKPVIWIDANGRRERRYLPTPSPRDAADIDLATYKGHALAMGRKRLMKIAARVYRSKRGAT
jgi:hypothetical protein